MENLIFIIRNFLDLFFVSSTFLDSIVCGVPSSPNHKPESRHDGDGAEHVGALRRFESVMRRVGHVDDGHAGERGSDGLRAGVAGGQGAIDEFGRPGVERVCVADRELD